MDFLLPSVAELALIIRFSRIYITISRFCCVKKMRFFNDAFRVAFVDASISELAWASRWKN